MNLVNRTFINNIPFLSFGPLCIYFVNNLVLICIVRQNHIIYEHDRPRAKKMLEMAATKSATLARPHHQRFSLFS